MIRKLAYLTATMLSFMMIAGITITPANAYGNAYHGLASYYGGKDGLHGSKTASGQRFNMYAMTAAHRTLPFGTKVKVTHRGRSVVVTINDRGPFIRGRIIDLSRAAAFAIGITGVERVSLQVM